ncbi:MAG TPA: anthranilate phosphoribosyltransferase [Euzebyales bacterium]|nr:anthranilate phosphoribosyltransferase [Euzebyales bacterium]
MSDDAAGGSPEAALSWPELTERLIQGDHLTAAESHAAMTVIMDGAATPVQIAGFLVALRAKGETAAELAGLVRAMREFAIAVPVEGPTLDTCGTGGDRSGTFNISTVAAIVAAAAGARVAKHGNRAASGRCGSADLLEAWGVAISLPPDAVVRCIDEVGIGFCFAPSYHPAMRHVIPVRRELAVRTVFNSLGPLSNPAGAQHQTIGVSDYGLAERMAGVLAQVGTTHALVFHGADGLDELTVTAPSHLWEVRGGDVVAYEVDPADLGIAYADPADLVGGEVEVNRAMADAVLDGKPGAPRDAVVLAAGAALYAADHVDDITAGTVAASEAIDSGAARGTQQRWVALSQELAADQ